MRVCSFTLAKATEENEDAADWAENAGVLCAAIADGASSDAFSGLWARCLVESFCQTGGLYLEEARGRWQATVSGQTLPWFLADKLRQGTHAAFLGIALSNDSEATVSAVGDCCLFHLGTGGLITSFPLTSAGDLGRHPALIGTRGAPTVPLETTLSIGTGEALLLATDALAGWLLQEKAQEPWASLLALQNPSDFARFISALRTANRLVRDDTTLVIVRA